MVSLSTRSWRSSSCCRYLAVVVLVMGVISATCLQAQTDNPIDWNKAKQLWQKQRYGKSLTPDEEAYLNRAREERRTTKRTNRNNTRNRPRNPNAGTRGDNQRPARTGSMGVRIDTDLCPIEKITATTEDKQTIRAFYRKPPGKGPFPAVICIHGGVTAAGDRTLTNLLAKNPVYTRLLANGYVTVAGDFRTYGQQMQSRGPIYDGLATFNAVSQLPFVDAKSVAVYGGSGGGSIALQLAVDAKPAAIVCGEPASLIFMGMLDHFNDRFRVMENPQSLYTNKIKQVTQEKIKRIECPILILHGDVHPLKILNGQILLPELKAAKKEVVYKIYPGNEHGFFWGQARPQTVNAFMNDTLTFLQSHLETKPKPIDTPEVNAQLESIKQATEQAKPAPTPNTT